jgi:hypothetical protein
MATTLDGREPEARLDLLRRGLEIDDGDQDVVELHHRKALRQIAGTLRE